MSAPPEWEDLLGEDETILCQGRPDSALVLRVNNTMMFVFGLFFAGFALFWILDSLHFAVGLGLAFGGLFWNAYRRQRGRYTLNDKRDLIATDLPLQGRRLASYPITPNTQLEFEDGPVSSVYFGTETVQEQEDISCRKVGFDRIVYGGDVYRLMRKIQSDAQGPTETQ